MPDAAATSMLAPMSVSPPRQCRMASIAGRPEECPEDVCPFWEHGGAVLPGRCGFDQIDLADNPDLAGYLLRIRHALEQARTHEDEHQTRRLFYHALNQGQDE
jgi:hypothetical protein